MKYTYIMIVGGVKEKPDKGALGGLISTYKSDESEDDIRDYSSLESDVEGKMFLTAKH